VNHVRGRLYSYTRKQSRGKANTGTGQRGGYHISLARYEICHETFGLSRLCCYIFTGKTNVERQKDGVMKQFCGVRPNKMDKLSTVDEVWETVRVITDKK